MDDNTSLAGLIFLFIATSIAATTAMIASAFLLSGCAPPPTPPGRVPFFVACETLDDMTSRHADCAGVLPPCPWLAADDCDPLLVLESVERARRVNYCAEVLPALDAEACR